MMRFILVDYARRHARARRGGGAQKVTLEDAMLVSEDKGSELLLLDEALQKLEQFDKRKSQIAVMRFFAGLTVEGVGRSSRHFGRNGDARLATGACLVAK